MKIVVGGQIDKKEIAEDIHLQAPNVEVSVLGDLEAAMAIKNGDADFYIGACNTGGGGALAMALALLGKEKCVTLSMPGNIKSEEDIRNAVQEGKVAFGFTAPHRNRVLPVLLDELGRLE